MSSGASGPAPPKVLVAGAGIVGLATALKLSTLCRASVLVVEAEEGVARHQTGRNSGVIHSGLYYKPGSLKARLCRSGRLSLIDFCQERSIPHEICGKLVVATTESEKASLSALEERGRANGLLGVRRIEGGEIPGYEPHARGVAALVVPETGIVDYAAVAGAMAAAIREAGGEVRPSARLLGLSRTATGLLAETSAGPFPADYLVNCCGLQSDRVARTCGVAPGVRIVPFRGEYYDLTPEKRELVKNLIYPVPDPRYPFLGVHFTRRVDGTVEAGPNAVFAFKREGYTRTSLSVRDTFDSVTAPGFFSFARTNWRAGIDEFRRSFSKRLFVAALQKLIPEIVAAGVTRGGCGVRAQALDSAGRLVDDFHVVSGERTIHVLNAPSPAATASLAIGEAIAGRAAREFGLSRLSGAGVSEAFTALQ
ncbi:MAG: L-2-hydroxyglutarate oxidase LhgO [Thermoanaerobaculia bacterium]|nr:L-2-hydroxyglutarate oxidase LhgO [Thermoanaerobaculia bacterium]